MASKKPVKKVVKKTPAKKASAKMPVAKKVPAKKPATKKSVKAPVVLKSIKGRTLKPAKKKKSTAKKVPLRIIKKAPPPKHVEVVPEVDTEKAVAFAMSIAQEMKRSAAQADAASHEHDVRLARRPTTRKQGAQTESFPVTDLKEFRKRLLAARQAALAGANAMKTTGFTGMDDHESDGGDGTNQTLRLQALGQVGTLNRTLQQIEEALHRIDDGTYGVCTVCGQLIRKPRLLNQPFVLTCMECQSAMEKNR